MKILIIHIIIMVCVCCVLYFIIMRCLWFKFMFFILNLALNFHIDTNHWWFLTYFVFVINKYIPMYFIAYKKASSLVSFLFFYYSEHLFWSYRMLSQNKNRLFSLTTILLKITFYLVQFEYLFNFNYWSYWIECFRKGVQS